MDKAQLHDEGKMTEAHAALAKEFSLRPNAARRLTGQESGGEGPEKGIVADYKAARFFAAL